jgi:hypothetical protein
MPCSRSRDRRRGAAAALLFMLAACARPAPAPPPPAPSGDPLAVVRQRAAALRTLRAQFDSVAHFAGGERAASGVLIVRQPGDARLRLVAPFGFTVFDGLRTGGRTYVDAPLAADKEAASLAFMRVGPAESVLFGAGADDPCLPADDAPSPTAAYWCGAPPTRWLVVDRATATLLSETELANGTPVATRSYGDYRDVAGTPLPYRIRIEYPQKQASVDITVTTYELNPALRDDQFAPPKPSSQAGRTPRPTGA